MRKRMISLLLTIVLLVSLLPMPAAAVSADEREQVRAAVDKVITDYAKQVGRSAAAGDAFEDFFMHGFFGNGKKMVLKESDALIATAFATNWLPIALTEGITAGITVMQKLSVDELYLSGSPIWHTDNSRFDYFAFNGNKWDLNEYLGMIISSTDIFGSQNYKHPYNECDEMMSLLGGSVDTQCTIRKTGVTDLVATYEINLLLKDRFDFDGQNYEALNKQGISTVKDERLNYFGKLLTFMGLDEFEWEFKKTFRIEVPADCDHNIAASYRWNLNDNTKEMHSYVGEEYTENHARLLEVMSGTKVVLRYYQLDDTVTLRHDAPWIVELEQNGHGQLSLGPLNSNTNKLPKLFQSYGNIACVMQREINSNGTEKYWNEVDSKMHYTGVDLTEAFSGDSNHRFVWRFENRVNPDGSNMIYFSVYDLTNGEMVFEPAPMTTDWVMKKGENKRVIQDGSTNRVSGQDILINYIGDSSASVVADDLEIRIFENGVANTTYRAPTCTEQGGTVHTCADCGYAYLTDTVSALGHSYGEYTFDNNASCTADGTQTRECTVCGVTETIAAPDTAKGHSYDAVVTLPTYTEQGYTTYTCTVCGDSYKDDYTDVKEHEYEAVVTAPTCTERGYTTYTCTNCGDSYVDDYTELAEHTVVIDPEVPPTCVEKGKTEGSHCGVCGLVLKKQAAISVSQKHRMEETLVSMPTYDAPGRVAYVCQDCGKTDYMEIPPLNKPTSTNPFTDVLESDWFYEPVLWAVKNKVTGGKTETTFAPNEGCTRAQVVTFLWAANGKPAPTSMENPFTDIADSDWYYNAVLWAVEQGITTGVTATEFGPEQVCTRAQIVTFLYAAQGKPDIKAETSPFTDVADTEWFVKPVLWAAENDVTGGIGEGKFGPNDTCTRAQVVTFLKKVYG